ncbi:MAG: hypothetical protein KC466_04570, partial [Myxococcales bacterium]|nr:hypothetical protein [Myxococcales bacterium]
PLAVEALARAGVPSVVVANFSWDWIYRAFVPEEPRFAPHVARIAAQYGEADLLLQPPIVCDLAAFRRRRDVPLICRRSRLSKEEARAAFGLPAGVKVILLSFGGIGTVRLNPGRRYQEDWLFVGAGRVEGPPEPFRLTPVTPALRYPDLVRAADVVVTKPGYGIFAECTANRAAMAHTDRGPFAEQRVLVEGMGAFLPHAFIPPEAFALGDWESPIRALLDGPVRWPDVTLNGAERTAAQLDAFVS